ncbi:MAG TPA: universal stress protein [Acidimicrobiales bacterium]|nr:universal stress protein [Acidimicrobiales bacterium]
MGRIVVGVDGSEPSKRALELAARQAHLTGDLLQVVTAWELPPLFASSSAAAVTEIPVDLDLAGEAEERLHRTIDEVLGAEHGLELHTTVVEGHPAPSLLDAAEGADLVVVGSSGHGEFAGMLLGSVSMYLATHSPCPVLIARSKERPGS